MVEDELALRQAVLLCAGAVSIKLVGSLAAQRRQFVYCLLQ
jgi:hypothetical protein